MRWRKKSKVGRGSKRPISTKPPSEESLTETIGHTMKGHKYLIRIEYDDATGRYDRHDSWSDMKKETLARLGYREAVKFLDDLRYTGAKAYILMINFKEAEAPNAETSSTLADFYMSDAPADFQKGLTKTNFPKLDVKQLMLIIPIIIGLVLGIYFLFLR